MDLELYFDALGFQDAEPRYEDIFREATANPAVSTQILNYFSQICMTAPNDYGAITPGPRGINYRRIRNFLLESHRLTHVFRNYNNQIIPLQQFENMIRFITAPVRYLDQYIPTGPGAQGQSTQDLNTVINMVREKYSMVIGVLQLQRSTTNFDTLIYRPLVIPKHDDYFEEGFFNPNQ